MPIFTHFYIVTRAGTCIYSKSSEEQADQHLLPGFMTTIDTFTRSVLPGSLESVSLGKSRYFVSSAHGLLFVARADLNAKENLAKKDLVALQALFFSIFGPEKYSGTWDNIKDASQKLDASYERFFKESDQKMREAIW